MWNSILRIAAVFDDIVVYTAALKMSIVCWPRLNNCLCLSYSYDFWLCSVYCFELYVFLTWLRCISLQNYHLISSFQSRWSHLLVCGHNQVPFSFLSAFETISQKSFNLKKATITVNNCLPEYQCLTNFRAAPTGHSVFFLKSDRWKHGPRCVFETISCWRKLQVSVNCPKQKGSSEQKLHYI